MNFGQKAMNCIQQHIRRPGQQGAGQGTLNRNPPDLIERNLIRELLFDESA